jgi:hypothetical protein
VAGFFRRVVVPVLAIGLTICGLLNTYGDSAGVEKLAADAACGGTPCEFRMTEFTRSPFSHEYAYAIGKSGERVAVTCARQAIFVGDYRCTRK